MSNLNITIVEDDVIVVGGGDAAMRAALSAAGAGAKVRVIIKSRLMEGGSSATGISDLMSIGAAMGFHTKEDCPQHHYEDTLKAAEGFISPELTRIMTEEIPDRVQELIDWGVPFEQNGGVYQQRQSDYARCPRVLWVDGGRTARSILSVLLNKVRALNVPIEEDTMVFELLENGGAFAGALAVRRNGELLFFRSKAVILATGGSHRIFPNSVGTKDMTGDGCAMAARLGLPLVNMEFTQIGPGIIWPEVIVLSGPVYPNKPIFTNVDGRDLFEGLLPDGITPANVIEQKVFPYTTSNISKYLEFAIYRGQKQDRVTEHGGVYMDLRGEVENLEKRLPVTTKKLNDLGLNLGKQLVEVGIVTQCINGGVRMESADAETGMPGVYVVGEAAGGVRGPDRPGGNALCECQVFGYRAGKAAARYASGTAHLQKATAIEERVKVCIRSFRADGALALDAVIKEIQSAMRDHCLVVRTEKGLLEGIAKLDALSERICSDGIRCKSHELIDALSVLNMIDSAKVTMTAALARKESRGPHYREDYPLQDDDRWKRVISVTRDADGGYIAE